MIEVDGVAYDLAQRDGLFIPMKSEEVVFRSNDAGKTAP